MFPIGTRIVHNGRIETIVAQYKDDDYYVITRKYGWQIDSVESLHHRLAQLKAGANLQVNGEYYWNIEHAGIVLASLLRKEIACTS